jgi:F-type H+-transporting ATPase subunit b
MDFTRIGLIFSGHGFGFNTNILETNVINLAVVIAVVVSVVETQCELLKNRKETIINNLREADRANEALEKRDLAKAQLQEAQKRAKEIRNKNFAAEQEKRYVLNKLRKMQIVSSKENKIQFVYSNKSN